MSRTVWIAMRVLVCAMMAQVCTAAEPSGQYIAQVTRGTGTPQYSRVTLKVEGAKVTGSWGTFAIDGSVTGTKLQLKLSGAGGASAGELSGTANSNGFAGDGSLMAAAGNRGGGGALGGAAGPQPATWNLTAYRPPDKPKTYDFEPTSFYTVYSAQWAPVLRIYPGDTVRTRTIDNARDSNAVRYGSGGNPSTGPFYIEGALPGDTLVVRLGKVRANRTTAQQGTRINGRAVTPAYFAAAQYDSAFDGSWTLDLHRTANGSPIHRISQAAAKCISRRFQLRARSIPWMTDRNRSGRLPDVNCSTGMRRI